MSALNSEKMTDLKSKKNPDAAASLQHPLRPERSQNRSKSVNPGDPEEVVEGANNDDDAESCKNKGSCF